MYIVLDSSHLDESGVGRIINEEALVDDGDKYILREGLDVPDEEFIRVDLDKPLRIEGDVKIDGEIISDKDLEIVGNCEAFDINTSVVKIKDLGFSGESAAPATHNSLIVHSSLTVSNSLEVSGDLIVKNKFLKGKGRSKWDSILVEGEVRIG